MSNTTVLKEEKTKMPHNLILEDRKKLIVNATTAVDNFDDKSINATTTLGELEIKGENLNIKKLNLELGDLEVEGKISSLVYKEKKSDCSSEGFWSKLFK